MKHKEYSYCPYCQTILQPQIVENKELQSCFSCGFIQYINPKPVVSIVIIDEDQNLLLVKRKFDPGKGTWALPGGFVDGHEHPQEAARRELKEETNIDGISPSLIGVYSFMSEFYGPLLFLGYSFSSFKGLVCAGDDALEAKFFPLTKLPDIPFSSHTTILKDFLTK